MVTAGFCYLAGQFVGECELWPENEATRLRRPLEEILTVLRKGALLLKHGRQGKPKIHFFRLTNCDTLLKWKSSSGSLRQVKLRTVNEVVAGQSTEVFKRFVLRETALSFSLKYTDDDGSHRTLDLTCQNQQQFDAWHTGLRVVADRLRVTGAPAVPAAAAFAAQLSSGSFTSVRSAAEAARCYGGGTAVGRVSGAMGIPVVEHTPGDLLAWGSASRATRTNGSVRSAAADREAWQRSKAPAPLQTGGDSDCLDVRSVAVGPLHGVVVTGSGAVYAWGEGRGGRLGLGHDQDSPGPQRLEQGLRGKCVMGVACGDDCTAALTSDGMLFMWGRLASCTRPQLVPVPVRGELASRAVTKVSCGPFHCAAVTEEGMLFTWGEGFGGKLGHGDQSCRAQPAVVQSLLGRQVLSVACGVWHTAAVVLELEGPLAQGLGLSLSAPMLGPEHSSSPGSPRRDLSLLAHHRRNSSASSAFSEASLFHEGHGGALYTWGGVNDTVVYGGSEKRDSNKGCLGHGEADLYSGQLLPTRVSGALEGKLVRQVAAGLHLTLALTTGGRVYQMGCTGAAAAGKPCPWEGATAPEVVKGGLTGFFVDSVSCGVHHVLCMARPLDRRSGRPLEGGLTAVFAWGKGGDGQLGSGRLEDSATPLQVEALRGRQVLQVAAGGSNVAVVCAHDARRFEPESKEALEEAAAAFGGMMESKPSKQLRVQVPDGYASGIMTTTRARSFLQRASGGSSGSGALVPYGTGGSLTRMGSRPLGGSGRPPTISEMYATLRSAHSAQRQQTQQSFRFGGGVGGGSSTNGRSRGGVSSGTGRGGSGEGSLYGAGAGGAAGGQPPRVLGVPMLSRRHAASVASSMPSMSGFSHTQSWGGGSELSSASSLRQNSEDWSVGGDSHHPASMAHASLDLGAIDETGSVASLNVEISEKNRVIQHLETKLMQLRRQASRTSSGDSDERLRQSVRASAGHFRESIQMGEVGSSGSMRSWPRSLGRPSMAPSEGGGGEGGQQQDASVRAMEAMLARRQLHLESQQRQLTQWALELQRKEVELQRAKAEAEGRPFTGPHPGSAPTPHPLLDPTLGPIPSESPVFHQRAQQAEQQQQPPGAGPFDPGVGPAEQGRPGHHTPPSTPPAPAAGGGAGYQMGTPAQPPPGEQRAEWMEEIETGVFVTYSSEGGVRKLKRIRFSRTVFSKDSAAQWYEANKHRLAQPAGTPRVTSHPPAHHGTPPAAAAPQPAHPLLQHSRIGSRNLSFDPAELAALRTGAGALGCPNGSANAPISQDTAPREGEGGAAPGNAAGAVQPSRPSRLSQVSRPILGELHSAAGEGEGRAGSEGARGAQVQAEAEVSLTEPPPSPFASSPRAAGSPPSLRCNPLWHGGEGRGSPPASSLQDQDAALTPPPEMPSQAGTLFTLPSSVMEGAAGEGGVRPRGGFPSRTGGSLSKRGSITQQQQGQGQAAPLARQGSVHSRSGSLGPRDTSRMSISSSKSETSRASGQFNPRLAAPAPAAAPVAQSLPHHPLLERKHSPHAAAVSALAASWGEGRQLPAAGNTLQADRPTASPFDVGTARPAAPASTTTPRAQSCVGAVAADGTPSRTPSRLSRLKAAFSSGKKKDKARREG